MVAGSFGLILRATGSCDQKFMAGGPRMSGAHFLAERLASDTSFRRLLGIMMNGFIWEEA